MTPRPRDPRQDAWMLNVMAERVLQDVVRVAGESRIDLLPVKGVVTARWLYDDVSERPLSDVDVRVRPGDVERMLEAGRARGWPVMRRSKAYEGIVFAHGSLTIDVESHVGPPGLSGLSVASMINRSARTKSLYGFEHLLPEIHDHALLLVVNAFKDKMIHAGAGAVEDLRRIVRHPDFDTETFVARAKHASGATEVWIVADWLATQPGGEAWRALRERFDREVDRRRFARWVLSLVRANDPAPMALRTLARMGADDRRLRVHALSRMAQLAIEQFRWPAATFGLRPFFTSRERP